MNKEQENSGNLILENITRIFENGVRAVDDVSLEIRGGEFLTLLGRTSCGKTTILRMIAGLDTPTQGRILLDGKDIGNTPPNRRPMAMVFQNYALFPHLDVFENIAFGLRLQKISQAEIREKVEMVLYMVDMAGLEKRYPNQLAGGGQQRVALARAMVVKPRLLLFDEPLSSLDARTREDLRKYIRRLQRSLGTTTIYVTHDQAEAMYLSDRIAVMNMGHIEQVGTPEEIYLRPASVFVAKFIGPNLIETRVIERRGDQATVTLLGKAISLPCDPDVRAGELAYAIVRPEAVRLAASVEGANGQVNSAVFIGPSVEYEVETAEQGLTALDYTPRPQPLFRPGDAVNVSFDTSRSYLLPADRQKSDLLSAAGPS